MRRWCALILAGLVWLGIGSAGATAKHGQEALPPELFGKGGGPLLLPPKLSPAVAGTHPIQVQAWGTLKHKPLPGLFGSNYPWYIEINGQTYGLDLLGNKLFEEMALSLKGKAVRITGKLKTVWHQPVYFPESPAPAPMLQQAIEVTGIEFVSPGWCGTVAPSIVMQVHATFELNVIDILKEGQSAGVFLKAQGKNYRVDFAGNANLAQVAKKAAGHKVLVRGVLEIRYFGCAEQLLIWPPKECQVAQEVFVVREIIIS